MSEYIVKIYTNVICNIFSGRFDVHLQVIQPILKFPYLISLIKEAPSTLFEIRKSLKRVPSLAYPEMDETNTAFHRCLHSDALFGHFYAYLHVHNLAG